MVHYSYLFRYIGQEKNARRLLMDERIVRPEELAVMSSEEVSEMIQKHYSVISTQDDEILLVRKEYLDTFKSITRALYR